MKNLRFNALCFPSLVGVLCCLCKFSWVWNKHELWSLAVVVVFYIWVYFI